LSSIGKHIRAAGRPLVQAAFQGFYFYWAKPTHDKEPAESWRTWPDCRPCGLL